MLLDIIIIFSFILIVGVGGGAVLRSYPYEMDPLLAWLYFIFLGIFIVCFFLYNFREFKKQKLEEQKRWNRLGYAQSQRQMLVDPKKTAKK